MPMGAMPIFFSATAAAYSDQNFKNGYWLTKILKRIVCFHLDPKEEKEDDSVLPQEVSITTTRASRSWRSSSRTSISRLRDSENTRSSRSKTGSLQLVCKTEPITDQLDYGMVQIHYAYFRYLIAFLILDVMQNIYLNVLILGKRLCRQNLFQKHCRQSPFIKLLHTVSLLKSLAMQVSQ